MTDKTHPTATIPLLPCPFCGGEANLDEHEGPHHSSRNNPDVWGVFCTSDKCACCIDEHREREEAIKAWNTRAGDSK